MSEESILASAEREIAVINAECRRRVVAATSRAERAERERDEARRDLDALTGLLLDIGETISPTGEWPPEAIGQLPAAVEQLDSRAERAEAAIQRVREKLAAVAEEIAWQKAMYGGDDSDPRAMGRLIGVQDVYRTTLAALDGTDNTGGTE